MHNTVPNGITLCDDDRPIHPVKKNAMKKKCVKARHTIWKLYSLQTGSTWYYRAIIISSNFFLWMNCILFAILACAHTNINNISNGWKCMQFFLAMFRHWLNGVDDWKDERTKQKVWVMVAVSQYPQYYIAWEILLFSFASKPKVTLNLTKNWRIFKWTYLL